MTNRKPSAANAKFCAACGTELTAGARFCQRCGAPVDGTPVAPAASAPPAGFSKALPWSVLALAVVALIALVFAQNDLRPVPPETGAAPLTGAMGAPDISNMSPEERADRLFNRVMSLASEGKTDSAAFFSTMALSALDALAPHNTHQRYDIGLVALVAGRVPVAAAQADTILAERSTHLLGLALAAQAADARGDAAAARSFRARLVAAEPAERARALPEYTDHDSDIRAATAAARGG
jgi:hypothetical protein